MKVVRGNAEVVCIYRIPRSVSLEVTVEDNATDDDIERALESAAREKAMGLEVATGYSEWTPDDVELRELSRYVTRKY